MSDTILIADARAARRSAAAPGFWQRVARDRAVALLRRLTSGAILLRERGRDELLGDPRGALGTVELNVHAPSFWSTLALGGSIGAGEAFVGGLWSTPDLVTLLRLLVRDRAVLLDVEAGWASLPLRLVRRAAHWRRRNHRAGSERNIADHYDLGDDLFARFLDPSMTYSSAWFEHPGQSLADAQQAKLRRLCRLVDLAPGDRLLGIGTGGGSLACGAAGEFGAQVTTTAISQNQFGAARRRVAAAGLSERVELRLQDYRDLDGTFDKLLSCEMVEAVGARYLPTYLRVCAERLRPGGLLGLQAITLRDQHYDRALGDVDYIQRHVFPGSFIPSVTAIVTAATRHTDLRLVRMEDFGPHYATTLQRWREAVEADPLPFLQRDPDGGLLRAWVYYFAYCEAGFRERNVGVCHLRFERAGA